MRRLRPLDRALLFGLLPLWAVCFVLYVGRAAHGRLAWVPIAVQAPENPTAYPTVREFLPGAEAKQSGLIVGDQLIRVGEIDLRGVGPFGFVARAYEATGSDRQVPIVFQREGTLRKTALVLTPIVSSWLFFPLTLGFVIAGVVTLVCEPGSRQARAFFLGSLAYSFHWTFFFGGSRLQTYAWAAVHFVSALFLLPLILRTAMVFPEKLLLVGSRASLWPWLFAVSAPIIISTVFGAPLPPSVALRANFIVNVAFLLALLVTLARNYRRATPIGRRQLKWIVYGLYIGVMPVLAADVITALSPSLRWLHEASMAALILIPICICIAILRMNFFDIDRLISATGAYSVLFAILIGAIMVFVPPLAEAANRVAGIESLSWQLTFSFALALLVIPGQRRLRPQIERFFFPVRYAIEQGLARLERALSFCSGPQELLAFVTEQVTTVLQPENFVLYVPKGDAYLPVRVRGSAVPLPLAAARPLVAALRLQETPLEVDRWRQGARAYLEAEDLEALDSLRATLVLPLKAGEHLLAFLCLGQKRSGDVYAATDVASLTRVLHTLSEAMRRFEGDAMRQQLEAMTGSSGELRSEAQL